MLTIDLDLSKINFFYFCPLAKSCNFRYTQKEKTRIMEGNDYV